MEPSFDPVPGSKFVLVTNTGLDQAVYNAWVRLLKAIGLPFEQFSVTRYGHFDPALPVLADGAPLAKHLAGKTIIVPNTRFDTGTPTMPVTRTPSWLLPGAAVRSHLSSPIFAAAGPARYLFVSDADQSLNTFGGLDHIVHPLTPPGSKRNGGKDYKTEGEFKSEFKDIDFLGHALVGGAAGALG